MNRKEMLARLRKGEDPLELSILKWQDIVDGKGRNLGTYNCALCEIYHPCKTGCPVEAKGFSGCEGTPYDNYYTKKGRKKRESAKAELEFLKSLRKEAPK